MYCGQALSEAGAQVRLFSLTRGEAFETALQGRGLQPIWIGPVAAPPLRLAMLARLLRPFRPHVVQSFHGFANLYVALIGRLLGAIGVGALRGTLSQFRQANGPWAQWLLRAPTGLIVNSRAVFQQIIDRGYLPRQRIFLLPNVINLDEFDRSLRSADPTPPPPSNRCTVIFIGRLVPEKRGDRFLRAIDVAFRRGASVAALVVGDGPERPHLEALARSLGLLGDQVTFLGSRWDVPALLARADILISCSDDEGLPNVILEAMAARRAVIATPAGDAPVLVADGVNGYVVPFEDIEQLGDRIVRLAASPDLRGRLGAHGRQLVEQTYDGDGLAHRLLSIYRDVAQGVGQRHLIKLLGALGC
jgi:starch synthase (maltosyl-transferring)